MSDISVIFVRGKAAVYHVLSPWETFRWSEEMRETFALLLCGHVIAKIDLKNQILNDLTNLRLCGSCGKRVKENPNLAQATLEHMKKLQEAQDARRS